MLVPLWVEEEALLNPVWVVSAHQDPKRNASTPVVGELGTEGSPEGQNVCGRLWIREGWGGGQQLCCPPEGSREEEQGQRISEATLSLIIFNIIFDTSESMCEVFLLYTIWCNNIRNTEQPIPSPKTTTPDSNFIYL